MSIQTRNFGTLKDGTAVTAWTIDNGKIQATILDYGATIQSVLVPDHSGKIVDVVLGYDTPAEYQNYKGCAGATIGRVGNRIGGASFSLGGKTYELAKNNGENHLHGGIIGFDKCMWKAEKTSDTFVTFSRLSPDGEEGYPGNLQVQVTFTVTESALKITYDAQTDADTLVNLTNHSYFNLNGEGSVLNHTLFVAAERFTENDAGCLPTGKILSVQDTPFDFRIPKRIGKDIDVVCEQIRNGAGYDHNFVLTGAEEAAIVVGDKSGIRMTMKTDRPGVQVYTANHFDERKGKKGAIYSPRGAVCLETQLYPNAMRCYGFPSPVLHVGEKLHSETVYAFDVE